MLEIPDVDLGDAGNLQLCSEYVKDIYSYLRHLEGVQAIRPHYLEGQEVTGSMRAILIDWLVKVQVHFNLLQETLFMATAILDRFLQVEVKVHTLAKYLLELTLLDYDMRCEGAPVYSTTSVRGGEVDL
ncbi:hypothetical protein JZ751_018222 [Albula glossodonta]|uniref:Cyclin N-terminal domain-containing protein n=1 Tax=Albula glossodonta TaxID=121402 RepID=A0A8T2NNG5_9TELE|nr:hypothetical protein JZ751_018222 [Albula glossodonta]